MTSGWSFSLVLKPAPPPFLPFPPPLLSFLLLLQNSCIAPPTTFLPLLPTIGLILESSLIRQANVGIFHVSTKMQMSKAGLFLQSVRQQIQHKDGMPIHFGQLQMWTLLGPILLIMMSWVIHQTRLSSVQLSTTILAALAFVHKW